MKKCFLCGELTEGSVGAAGIKWSSICQPCKDKEDAACLAMVQQMSKCFDKLFEAMK